MMVLGFSIAILTVFHLVICTLAQNVFLVAPNTFRLSSDETVGLLVPKGVPGQSVTLYLQDLPGKTKNFSKIQINAKSDVPEIVKMRVNPGDIPDLHLSTMQTKHYVLLVAEGKTFRKDVKVLVGQQSGYLFIQTDKPIYTPKQTVHVRIIPLNEDMVSDNRNFTIEIRNPQNVVVEQTSSTKLNTNNGLFTYNFDFPPTAIEGEWSFIVIYGHKVLRNETVTFELKKYTLPTFDVKLKVPHVVLSTDIEIQVEVEAKYVYGKNVVGSVSCKFGVMSETKKTIYVGNTDTRSLELGKATCRVNRATFEAHEQVGWFPKIEGSHLVVEAEVTEKATGEQEKAVNQDTLFSRRKYLVDFKRSLRDFQPGLVTTIVVDIKDITGRNIADVDVRINARDQNGPVKSENNRLTDKSNAEGQVTFLVSTNTATRQLTIEATTNDIRIAPEAQGKGTHLMYATASANYVALDRTVIGNTFSVGRNIFCNVYSSPDNLAINYAISSGGRILTMGTLSGGVPAKQRPFQFAVTDQMVPNFRITLFTIHAGQLLIDSVKINVQRQCRKQAQIHLDTTFKGAQPGQEGSISVIGTPNTVVGLLAVDSAVYALRNKGLLTKEKMFSKMEEHDLGCGPGGGLDPNRVLANAGLIILSDTSTSAPERPSCTERRLYKREIRKDLLRNKNPEDILCCHLASFPDKLGRSCEARHEIIKSFHDYGHCADVFLQCCNNTQHLYQQVAMGSLNRDVAAVGLNPIDQELFFVEERDFSKLEDTTQERKDFRETWIFDTGIIGPNKRFNTYLNVPHSITTWKIQAVGLNPQQGLCVADPIEAEVFKNIFIQMKLPYSVIRNEQVELRATIFNYGITRLPVVVYMYGVEGLCSEAEPNERGEPKTVYVSGSSAETVTFPVVPLKIGRFAIKIVALVPKSGSDEIVKYLNVIAEGVPHEESIIIDIDPANLDKRKRRSIVTDRYETIIDEERKRQVSFVKLYTQKEPIPGTESCHITAIGEKFGPTVHTSLTNLDKFIRMPSGCGEQNMIYMAPTLYTIHYLKVTGKMTAEHEKNGYKYIREGYKRELGYRKTDGSFAAFPHRPSSTWLTAFVAKVFCQASKYVFIDESTTCSALDWLVKQQAPDGSFTDQNPVIHSQMTGGIKGTIPMTAFVTNAFFKCDCKRLNLSHAKSKSVEYLKKVLPTIRDPYHLAIVAYALSLADPIKAGHDANGRLLNIATEIEGLNQRYWGQAGTPLSVEASSFALLTQLIHNNRDVAASIVNWLNTQRDTKGFFRSTQDTVIALESLAEYSVLARDPEMSLTCNLTSNSDVNFAETLEFRKENVRVLRSFQLKKLGGRLNIEAMGTGFCRLGVQLRYNVPRKPDEVCKFDIKVEVTDVKKVEPNNGGARPLIDFFPDDLMENLGFNEKGLQGATFNLSLPHSEPHSHQLHSQNPWFPDLQRMKRQAGGANSKLDVNISICVQYLFNKDSNMAVVDTGIFSGYTVNEKDLKRIKDDKNIPIERIEKADRNVIFYFEKIPHAKQSCFWFIITREYSVSNLESSVIKVYDYYNPDHRCSKFFTPNHNSAILQVVCDEKVCQCGEGGCPPQNPFEKITKRKGKERSKLLEKACDYGYVWKVEVKKVTNDNSSFQSAEVNVLKVLKPGRETREDLLETVRREFLVRQRCSKSGHLTVGKTYIIMGRDNEPIQQDNGQLKYIYYLNKQTAIHEWFDIYDRNLKRTVKEKELQKTFLWLEDQFSKREGCIH